MEKGIKKGHPLPTKVVDEPSYKRPLHGFCYTHFNMESGKILKISDISIEKLSTSAKNIQTLTRLLKIAEKSSELDQLDTSRIIEMILEQGFDIGNIVDGIEVEQ
ncbi:MAG: hypothetical protein SOH50_01550 [Leuconostoc mesenteroides]|jgi:hypothetical protein|uniref:hypothetical protein n=1 Tax=Leuconostoc mesenteroides TaxID=1245 RepID=UPI000E09D735|nr:hypothetical protein [Leuconostoc mesenteroides]RDF88239.1 hypothetical protein DQM10_08435 [Leuconostoc mesenteroides subsp. mesenteroides]